MAITINGHLISRPKVVILNMTGQRNPTSADQFRQSFAEIGPNPELYECPTTGHVLPILRKYAKNELKDCDTIVIVIRGDGDTTHFTDIEYSHQNECVVQMDGDISELRNCISFVIVEDPDIERNVENHQENLLIRNIRQNPDKDLLSILTMVSRSYYNRQLATGRPHFTNIKAYKLEKPLYLR